jgi:cytochrome c6
MLRPRALRAGALFVAAIVGAVAVGAAFVGARPAPAAAGTNPGAPDEAAIALGRQVFVELSEPRCGICHTFADAGATGEIGPNLDMHAAARDLSRVRAAIEQGVGSMPPFVDALTPEQIEAVALYVATRAGKEGSAEAR